MTSRSRNAHPHVCRLHAQAEDDGITDRIFTQKTYRDLDRNAMIDKSALHIVYLVSVPRNVKSEEFFT